MGFQPGSLPSSGPNPAQMAQMVQQMGMMPPSQAQQQAQMGGGGMGLPPQLQGLPIQHPMVQAFLQQQQQQQMQMQQMQMGGMGGMQGMGGMGGHQMGMGGMGGMGMQQQGMGMSGMGMGGVGGGNGVGAEMNGGMTSSNANVNSGGNEEGEFFEIVHIFLLNEMGN